MTKIDIYISGASVLATNDFNVINFSSTFADCYGGPPAVGIASGVLLLKRSAGKRHSGKPVPKAPPKKKENEE